MKQHVLAFAVALAVWVVGGTIMNLEIPEASARPTSLVEGHCKYNQV